LTSDQTILACPAEYFDGTSAVSRQVQVRLETGELVIAEVTTLEELERWEISTLHWLSGSDNPVLTQSLSPDARLILADTALANAILKIHPMLKKAVKTAKSVKTHKMAWRYGIAALLLTVGVLVAVPWLSAPLASLASDEWRERMGRQSAETIQTFFGKTCKNSEAQQALDTLTDRLADELPLPEVLHVGVIDNKMINAFALPGGYIRFMRGLIKEASSAEEVAGVLAHEMGHVVLRHAEEQTFRQLGYQIVLSTFADSGTMTEIAGSVGVYLVDAAHSREAESAADDMAFNLLTKAGIRRDGMVSFFERIEKMEGESPKILKYLSTHPATGERKKAAEASSGSGEAALSDKDWQALKKICD